LGKKNLVKKTELPGSIIDKCVLQQRQEDEGDAKVRPNVDGLRVGDGRQRIIDRRSRRRHRQQRRHRQRDASRRLKSNNGVLTIARIHQNPQI